MKPQSINLVQLQERLESSSDLLLIDVVAPEYYEAEHLPSAQSASVFEATFLDQVTKLAQGDKTREIILYGAGGGYFDSTFAAEKLLRADFTNVFVYPGGLAEWQENNLPTEKNPEKQVQEPKTPDGRYLLKPESASIFWIGRNIKSKHYGTLAAKQGFLEFLAGQLSAGQLVIDMQQMTNLDIPSAKWQQVLIDHLKSDDFFDTERFPSATFTLKAAEKLVVNQGQNNYRLKGDLEIKGVSNEVECLATITAVSESTVALYARLDFDRTKWQVFYGSSKFFTKLGKHLVKDTISLEVVGEFEE
jgi:polyisoprenoid-binding protein YceI